MSCKNLDNYIQPKIQLLNTQIYFFRKILPPNDLDKDNESDYLWITANMVKAVNDVLYNNMSTDCASVKYNISKPTLSNILQAVSY